MTSYFNCRLELISAPKFISPGESVMFVVKIYKETEQDWLYDPEKLFNLSYHWRDSNNQIIVWDGVRTELPQLRFSEGQTFPMRVIAPDISGEWLLEITLVQDNVAWFPEEDCPPIKYLTEVKSQVLNQNDIERLNYLQQLSTLNKNFYSWDEYLSWSTINRVLFAPYSEIDHTILRTFAGYQDYFKSIYLEKTIEPLVSIIMPVYNRATIVSKAIESILLQSYQNWELWIIDDCSSDQTINVLESYSDSRIKILQLPDNQGQSVARNLGLKHSRGEYLCYLDSDNYWSSDYLSLMINSLLEHPEAKSVYCAQQCEEYFINEKIEYLRFGCFNRSLLENKNYIDINCFLHHRSLYNSYGGFKSELRSCEDWELILRYTSQDLPIALPAILSFYLYDTNYSHASGSQSESSIETEINKLFSTRYFQRKDLNPKLPFPALDNINFYPASANTSFNLVKRITIIIPSYQEAHCLETCILSILKFTPEDKFQVIIVDNASNQEVQQLLDLYQANENFTIIRNQKNLGFTFAVNQGIQIAEAESDIVLLNNDTIVTEGWLAALQEVTVLRKNAGIIVPQQVLPANTETILKHLPYANSKIEVDVSLSQHHHNLTNPQINNYDGLLELNFAPFFCVYLTRTCLNKLRSLDATNGRHYFSDNIYCNLIRDLSNLKIFYTPKSKVYHLLQQSTKALANIPGDYQEIFLDKSWKGYPQLSQNNSSEKAYINYPNLHIEPFQAPQNLTPLSEIQIKLINDFTSLYYSLWEYGTTHSRHTLSSWWLGHLAQKCPLDLWIYQEILTETQPDLIIKCGTNHAGSTLFLASICELLGKGSVLSIDIEAKPDRPAHSRIKYLNGSSTDPKIVEQVRVIAKNSTSIMVILDSDHSKQHVWRELNIYSGFVTNGNYLIVEDTAINGHPYLPDFGPGPMEALNEFLLINKSFQIDLDRERFLTTLNPRGYLKKVTTNTTIYSPQKSLKGEDSINVLMEELLNLNNLAMETETQYPVWQPTDLLGRLELRESGLDWPESALTMIGYKRLQQFRVAIEEVLDLGIPGDIVEAGVWRGGACILARAILKSRNISDRSVWVVDSFAGLPIRNSNKYPADSNDQHYEHTVLQISEDQVKANFQKYDLLDQQVKFLPGWFSNTLPNCIIQEIAVLRLDGDLYESTLDSLNSLYPKLLPGGIIIIDDYSAIPSCKQAVNDYREKFQIESEIINIDGTGVYWRKSSKLSCEEIDILQKTIDSISQDSCYDLWINDLPDNEKIITECRELIQKEEIDQAKALLNHILQQESNYMPAHQLLAEIEFPGPDYLEKLKELHHKYNPRVYIELGVFKGQSLKLAQNTKRIGVDPRPLLPSEWNSTCDLYLMTSSEFFAKGHADFAFQSESFDLAFIDGSHHFEQALLDFMSLERFANSNSRIILHDTLPINSSVADSLRSTTFYTGDIWKLLLILIQTRPDLEIETYPCYPSGLTLISNLDNKNNFLWENYHQLVTEFQKCDFDTFLKNKCDFGIIS